MRRREAELAASFILAAVAGAAVLALEEPLWALTAVSMGASMGSLGAMIAARRLYYLAAVAPHAALAAAPGGVIAASLIPISPLLAGILLGAALIYVAGYLIYRGVSGDTVGSLTTSASAAAGVVLVAAAQEYPGAPSISEVLLGDPLLVSQGEVIAMAALSIVALATAVKTHWLHVLAGISRDVAVLSGRRLYAYDWALFTVLSAASTMLVTVIGLVMEHVLLLLSAIAAGKLSDTAKGSLALAVSSAIWASAIGTVISLRLDIPVSGGVGASMIIALAIMRVYRR